MFYRWLFNTRIDPKEETGYGQAEGWVTPSFVMIRERQTKRLSPYSETEIWERDELLLLVKYVQNKRDKAALTLFWDLDARNHEVTLLKIKHIRLKEQYGEGEI